MKGTKPETRRPSIADGYRDLLLPLDEEYRRSLIRVPQGFHEGWRSTRRELAALIAQDTGPPVGTENQTLHHGRCPQARRR